MSALAQLDLPCSPATDGEIAAINLESARRRAWERFGQDARAPGIADVSAARVFDARYRTWVETRMETDMLRNIADLVMIGMDYALNRPLQLTIDQREGRLQRIDLPDRL